MLTNICLKNFCPFLLIHPLTEFGKKVNSKITFALNEKADYKASIKGYDKLARPQIEIKSKKNK